MMPGAPKTNQLRETLEQERQRLRLSLDGLGDGMSPEDNPDVEDLADLLADMERRQSMAELNTRLLEQVELALKRLDTGAYGLCAKCEQDIPAERLEALPYALMCVDCQSRAERTAVFR